MITTTSGAQLACVGRYVVKVGTGEAGDRIGTQARWLERHPFIAFPAVYVSWGAGYIMERLDPVPWRSMTIPDDWERFTRSVVDRLRDHVWCRPAETAFDLDTHLAFMRRRCENLPGSWPRVQSWAAELDWDVTETLTHGDPTFDNVCLRQSQPVLIDPNPNPAVPSTPVADLANLAQSLHGYEHVKGHPQPLCGLDVLTDGLDADDVEMLRYLTAAKFIRLLNYETTHRPAFASMAWELLA